MPDDSAGPPDIPRWMKELDRLRAEVVRGVEPVAKRVREAQLRIASPAFQRRIQEVQRAIKALPEISELVSGVRELGEQARAELRSAMPDNWRELDAMALGDLVELTAERGVAVVWAPRGEIVAELVMAATDAERNRILAEHANEILADLATVLSETTPTSLTDQLRAASEAVAAARDGHLMAAQSLVGSTLTQIVNGELGHARFNTARDTIRSDDPSNVQLTLLRRTALLHCLANAIEHTKHARPGFNRNSTAGHDGMFEQYTEANCLRGLLLLAGLLRELALRPPTDDEHANGRIE